MTNYSIGTGAYSTAYTKIEMLRQMICSSFRKKIWIELDTPLASMEDFFLMGRDDEGSVRRALLLPPTGSYRLCSPQISIVCEANPLRKTCGKRQEESFETSRSLCTNASTSVIRFRNMNYSISVVDVTDRTPPNPPHHEEIGTLDSAITNPSCYLDIYYDSKMVERPTRNIQLLLEVDFEHINKPVITPGNTGVVHSPLVKGYTCRHANATSPCRLTAICVDTDRFPIGLSCRRAPYFVTSVLGNLQRNTLKGIIGKIIKSLEYNLKNTISIDVVDLHLKVMQTKTFSQSLAMAAVVPIDLYNVSYDGTRLQDTESIAEWMREETALLPYIHEVQLCFFLENDTANDPALLCDLLVSDTNTIRVDSHFLIPQVDISDVYSFMLSQHSTALTALNEGSERRPTKNTTSLQLLCPFLYFLIGLHTVVQLARRIIETCRDGSLEL